MEKRISLGFILGFTGGFINLLFAVLAAYAFTANLSRSDSGIFFAGTPAVAVILIVLSLVNFIGACICQKQLAAGRALMYVTGLILLILFINSLSGVLSSAPETYPAGIPAYVIVFLAVITAAQCLSVAAAALLSLPPHKELAPEYGGIPDMFEQDDLKQTQRNEFQAVNSLYGLPGDVPKAETDKETDTKTEDTE